MALQHIMIQNVNNVRLASLRELPSGKFIWSGLGRASKQHATLDSCMKSAKKAFGRSIKFITG